ncbi:Cerato-platanin [Gautieria morchelliformis]|nr:Cerato-platanin [Gautieria morchelliformis]
MKLAAHACTLVLVAASALADTVAFDNTYDNAGGSLATVACSDGANGLLSRFPTFGSLPTFPNIGSAEVVVAHGSPNCGTCWQLAFNGKTINVLAIDHAGAGFNIAQAAMDTLTGGQAVALGRITATATELDASACGL